MEGIIRSDDQSSLATSRAHFFQSKQKEKNSVQNQDTWKDENNVIHNSKHRFAKKDLIDDSEFPSLNLSSDESLRTNAHVGAFAVAGSLGGINGFDESGLQYPRLSMALPSQGNPSVTITSARVVDDFIFNATLVEDHPVDNYVPNNLEDAAPKQGSILKFRLILFVSLLLLAGIVIPVVILTSKSQNDSPNVDTDMIAANVLLENLLPLLTNTSRQEIELRDSVPSLALDWLLNRSNFQKYTFDRQVQRYAMAVFYYSTGGRSWNLDIGWLTEDDECVWYQSSNESFCVNGTLRALSLVNNTLNGLLPNDIALLSSLEILDLKSNFFAKNIPTEVGRLKNLKALDFSSNSLIGSIPSEIGQCKMLKDLVLYSNLLDGSIPSEIGLCSMLTSFDLHENSLGGSLPREIGKCSKLTYLDLYENSLVGSLPTEIGQCSNLTYLDLYKNSLVGSLPTEIVQCSNLKYLDLYENSLVGTLPSEISLLTGLVVFDFNSNSLSGLIPSEIGRLTKLELLSFYNNSLVGSVPSEIGQFTNLTVLDLKSNSLIGSLPSEIGQCTKLTFLGISGNSFIGSLPSEYGALTNL